MNLHQRIKAAVTTRQAAESYGLKISPSGMALCPFHDDHHPSLKLDKRYYCFGCGEQGDVIDFTARYLGVSPHSAAIQLARDFGIDPHPPSPRGNSQDSSWTGRENIADFFLPMGRES